MQRVGEVDIFYPGSFVIQISMESFNIGTTNWASQSAEEILKTGTELSFQNLSMFLPRCIRKPHEEIMRNFYKYGFLKFSYSFRNLWMVTLENQLFSCKIFSKMLYEAEKLSFLTYVQKNDESSLMVLDRNGEMNSFGKGFNKIMGIKSMFIDTLSHPTVFLSLPQLIPFFLPYFYDLPMYKLEVC